MNVPSPEEFEAAKPALVEVFKRMLEKARIHFAKEDGHDATYGCKRCRELSGEAGS